MPRGSACGKRSRNVETAAWRIRFAFERILVDSLARACDNRYSGYHFTELPAIHRELGGKPVFSKKFFSKLSRRGKCGSLDPGPYWEWPPLYWRPAHRRRT